MCFDRTNLWHFYFAHKIFALTDMASAFPGTCANKILRLLTLKQGHPGTET